MIKEYAGEKPVCIGTLTLRMGAVDVYTDRDAGRSPKRQHIEINGEHTLRNVTDLDAAHRAVLRAFEVPERDRYQIVHENKAHHMVIEDTGLGLTRTRDLVVVRVYTSPRSEAQKQRFFAILQEELAEHCGLSGDDLMVSIISNQKGDWSFGRGVAQYLTGDL